MSDNTVVVILMSIFLGWIPILAFGKAISWCIEAKTCDECTCKQCFEESEDK